MAGVTDATPEHRERAIDALTKHGPLTVRQLIARGSCWRAVMALSREGQIAMQGTNGRAAPLFVYASRLSCEECGQALDACRCR